MDIDALKQARLREVEKDNLEQMNAKLDQLLRMVSQLTEIVEAQRSNTLKLKDK